MRHMFSIALFIAAAANCVDARDAITESTDPARAAAVEQAARDIQARAAQRAAAGQPATSHTVIRGTTLTGWEFLSGGITTDDQLAMHRQRSRYSLWVATVAKPSGAYLSDARLRIHSVNTGSLVVDRKMDGPWFLLSLPEGRYEVQVTVKSDGREQTLAATIRVPAKGQRQAVFRFDSTAEVSSDHHSPFAGNPFDGNPHVQATPDHR